MARAKFVKKARKDHTNSAGEVIVKKGDSYYWWQFMYGTKQISKTPPTRSQLTQSPFLGTLYSLEDRLSGLSADDSMVAELQSIAEDARALGEECTESRDNMPDALQDSDTGILLEERTEAMETWADELEQLDCEIEEVTEDDLETEDQDLDEDVKQEKLAELQLEKWIEKLEEAQGIEHGL